MISTPFKWIVASLLTSAVATSLVLVHLDNRRLERTLLRQREEAQSAVRLAAENVRLNAVVTAQNREAEAAREVRIQLEQAKAEVAALEQRAEAQAREKSRRDATAAEALAINRDPTRGMTRLEHFQPMGQATPTAAFQTAVAAAMKGDETSLVRAAVMLPTTRAKAEQLIAQLPQEKQATWTPEKLAALWATSALTDIPALQITGETFEDAQHAVVTFRSPEAEKDEHVSLRLTPIGWKVILPTNAMDRLERQLNRASTTRSSPAR